jgi:hypothetical protein
MVTSRAEDFCEIAAECSAQGKAAPNPEGSRGVYQGGAKARPGKFDCHFALMVYSTQEAADGSGPRA